MNQLLRRLNRAHGLVVLAAFFAHGVFAAVADEVRFQDWLRENPTIEIRGQLTTEDGRTKKYSITASRSALQPRTGYKASSKARKERESWDARWVYVGQIEKIRKGSKKRLIHVVFATNQANPEQWRISLATQKSGLLDSFVRRMVKPRVDNLFGDSRFTVLPGDCEQRIEGDSDDESHCPERDIRDAWSAHLVKSQEAENVASLSSGRERLPEALGWVPGSYEDHRNRGEYRWESIPGWFDFGHCGEELDCDSEGVLGGTGGDEAPRYRNLLGHLTLHRVGEVWATSKDGSSYYRGQPLQLSIKAKAAE